MTSILAFSGRKGSGKNTIANLVIGQYLLYLGIVRMSIKIDLKGRLLISDLWGDTDYCGEFDIYRNNPSMEKLREEYIFPYIKLYSFADLLKKSVCIDILGLTYEQCFGSNKDKNTKTHLKWEDMPDNVMLDHGETEAFGDSYTVLIPKSYGYMTAREVMQYVGTNIFRKMYNNVWADATIRQIQNDDSEFAIITDCRFPNEVEAVQNAGGKVIRLTRNPFKEDNHDSETMLDKDRFDWNKFDAVVDNEIMTIGMQNEAVSKILQEWNLIPEIK